MRKLATLGWVAAAAAACFGTTADADTPLPPPIDATIEEVDSYTTGRTRSGGNDWAAVIQAGYTMGVQRGLPAVGPEDPYGAIPLPGYGPTLPQNHPRPKAGLYPSPVQNTPPWHQQTIVTNQALAPHEMLYPHEYNAMYGPFYYKVCGEFIWTPFGVRTHENWKLQGTQVNVKYHDRIRLFSGFIPPRH